MDIYGYFYGYLPINTTLDWSHHPLPPSSPPLGEAFGREGQRAQPCASGRVDGVAHGGCDGSHAGLSHASGLVGALDDLHLNGWDLVHAHHGVVVKVALLHDPVLEGDASLGGGGESVDDAALHLGVDGVGVDHQSAVHRAPDAVQGDGVGLLHRELHHLPHHRAKGFMHGHAQVPSLAWALPAGHLGDGVQHGQVSGVVLIVSSAKVGGVFVVECGELVGDALDEKAVVGVSHGAPKAQGGVELDVQGVHVFGVGGVGWFFGSVDADDVSGDLPHKPWHSGDLLQQHIGHGDLIGPGVWLSFGGEPHLKSADDGGSVEAVLGGFFSAPDEFDRLAHFL